MKIVPSAPIAAIATSSRSSVRRPSHSHVAATASASGTVPQSIVSARPYGGMKNSTHHGMSMAMSDICTPPGPKLTPDSVRRLSGADRLSDDDLRRLAAAADLGLDLRPYLVGDGAIGLGVRALGLARDDRVAAVGGLADRDVERDLAEEG